MNIHEELWNAFNDINFTEESHLYTDSLGTIYRSATGWIKQFEAKINWDEKRKEKAKKLNIPDEELKKEWDRKSKYSSTLGTAVHSVLENLWYKKNFNPDPKIFEDFPEMKEDFLFRKKRCIDLFNKMKKIYVPIANEFIVYDQPNAVCGTIDFLAYNKINKTYAIIDWKTSKSFSTGNNFGNYLSAPFENVEDCNTAHYSLQLSLYAAIIEKYTSIKISDMILFQIPGKDVVMPEVYKCMNFIKPITDILNGKIKLTENE